MIEQAVGSRQQAVGMKITSHRDLWVWQRSFSLAVKVYQLTKGFPPEELYGLTSQMRRSAFSVPANIAEGYRRRGRDYVRFLRTSIGSGSELETYLLFTEELNLGNSAVRQECMRDLEEVLRMLSRLIESLG